MKIAHSIASKRPAVDRPEESGFTVPLVAMSLVAILLLATVALDGSQAYPQRRTAQNAADAAAVAAAQAMDEAMFFGGSAADIYQEALSVAGSNRHADHSGLAVDCTFIRYRQAGDPVDPDHPVTTDIGTCDASTTAVPSGAQGVRITAYVDRNTSFGTISGRSEVTAAASAAATVQKLNSTGSPFIVCANPSPLLKGNGNKPAGWDLLKTDPPNPTAADWATYARPFTDPFVFNADGTVDLDPAKVAAFNNQNPKPAHQTPDGSGFLGAALVGSENVVPACGVGGGNFDGNGSYETVSLPAWVHYQTGGGHSATAAEQVVSATPCPDPLPANYDANANPCDILLPLAIDARPVDGTLRVVSMAVFRITGNGTGMPKYYGKIRSDVRYASGGATNTDPVTAASMRVVRLVE